MTLELSPELAAHFEGTDAFDAIMALDGETFRHHKNRRTFKVALGGRDYFVKIHGHTDWKEIIKNRARGRAPILTAEPEWIAVAALETLGVPTVNAVGLGIRGRGPARLESFIITEALDGFVHLDDAASQWRNLPEHLAWRLRRTAANEIAGIARTIHGHGLNHRDFYLCHFMLRDRDWAEAAGQPLDLHVIDLHRMQKRTRTPRRWAIKDMAGIAFSSFDEPFSTLEAIRFMQEYFSTTRRAWSPGQRFFVKHMMRRAVRLYRKEHGRDPKLPRGLSMFG